MIFEQSKSIEGDRIAMGYPLPDEGTTNVRCQWFEITLVSKVEQCYISPYTALFSALDAEILLTNLSVTHSVDNVYE